MPAAHGAARRQRLVSHRQGVDPASRQVRHHVVRYVQRGKRRHDGQLAILGKVARELAALQKLHERSRIFGAGRGLGLVHQHGPRPHVERVELPGAGAVIAADCRGAGQEALQVAADWTRRCARKLMRIRTIAYLMPDRRTTASRRYQACGPPWHRVGRLGLVGSSIPQIP